jgi:hypothetical protein
MDDAPAILQKFTCTARRSFRSQSGDLDQFPAGNQSCAGTGQQVLQRKLNDVVISEM